MQEEVAAFAEERREVLRYVERRDAETWNRVMAEAIEGMLVRLRQSTSDHDRAAYAAGLSKRCLDTIDKARRKGQPARFHHGLHRLTETKLAALTAVHNVHTPRPDEAL